MTNFLKRLASGLTGKLSDALLPDNPVGTRCRASMPLKQEDVVGPRSCAAAPDNVQSESSPLDNLNYNRNGKIAHLPRALRDRINLALYNRCTAKDLARALNQMPEVKAVMAQSFNGRPLITQNIYEWKQGGYRDWLHHRQILEQKSELVADAKDLSNTADGVAESLFGILTLNYANLMINGDTQTPEEFEKHRKKLSLISHDISRMHRCHINARRVEVQEARLERDEEKTEEQLHFKFMEWTENPAIRRACILEPMEKNRQLRQHFGMPPTSDDLLLEKLARNDPSFRPSIKNQTKTKPIQTKKSHPDTEPINQPVAEEGGASVPASRSDKTSDVQKQEDTVGLRSSAAVGDKGELNTEQVGRGTPCPPSASDNSKPSPQNSPLLDYAGKPTSQIIAEIEAQYAQEKAAPLNPANSPIRPISPISPMAPGPKPKPQPSTLSEYNCALLAGKTHLEAMYAQATPAPANSKPAARPPGSSPWNSFSQPVHSSPRPHLSLHSNSGFKLTYG